MQKTITSASAAKTVAITINASTPPPTPPPATGTLKTIAKEVYDVVWVNNGPTRGNQIGTIAIGKACNDAQVGTGYYTVNKSDVTFTGTASGSYVVAKCAKS